jgi:arylsulfatase A-like enzyme
MKPNLLFLVVDSLRQDKCIGKQKSSVTPNLDKFIKNGTFFNQTISTASITVPSLSSIFTGLHPFECTILDNDLFNMIPNTHTFIQDLSDSGYTTSAIIPEALSHTNFVKIFSDVEFFNSFTTLYDGVGEKIINKIRTYSQETPWFLYVHLEDLHGNATFNLTDNTKQITNFSGKNQYEKMLSAVDVWLGKILENLDSDNTITIITSDHGSTSADFTDEMLKFNLKNDELRKSNPGTIYKLGHKIFTSLPESLNPIRKQAANIYTKDKNKKINKRITPRLDEIDKLNPTRYQRRLLKKSVVYPNDCYDENFRAALIFSGYKIPKNKIVKEQISSMDIFPTILETIEIIPKITTRGRSFASLFFNNAFEEMPVYLDSASTMKESEYSDTIGIRTPKFKYFRNRKNPKVDVHLFDLENDPFELDNISEQNHKIVEHLENMLSQINSTGNFEFKKIHELSDDETEKAKKILKELGYIK